MSASPLEDLHVLFSQTVLYSFLVALLSLDRKNRSGWTDLRRRGLLGLLLFVPIWTHLMFCSLARQKACEEHPHNTVLVKALGRVMSIIKPPPKRQPVPVEQLVNKPPPAQPVKQWADFPDLPRPPSVPPPQKAAFLAKCPPPRKRGLENSSDSEAGKFPIFCFCKLARKTRPALK